MSNNSDLIMRAEAIPTALLADMVRDAGHADQVMAPGICGITPPIRRVAGWAYTVAGGPPKPGETGPDYAKARAIDGMGEHQMAVWAGGGIEGVCLFGDLLGSAMMARGVRGAVVDGGVRDVDNFVSEGFAVYARYVTPKASTGFWRVRTIQQPVLFPGAGIADVEIRPKDLVVADTNGVVSLPASVSEDVVRAAEEHLGQESEVRSRIVAGESLERLMRQYGRI